MHYNIRCTLKNVVSSHFICSVKCETLKNKKFTIKKIVYALKWSTIQRFGPIRFYNESCKKNSCAVDILPYSHLRRCRSVIYIHSNAFLFVLQIFFQRSIYFFQCTLISLNAQDKCSFISLNAYLNCLR